MLRSEGDCAEFPRPDQRGGIQVSRNRLASLRFGRDEGRGERCVVGIGVMMSFLVGGIGYETWTCGPHYVECD